MKAKRIIAIGMASLLVASGCEKVGPKEVNHAPVAMIGASTTEGTKPLKVTFDGSQSTDPDEDVITYFWEFGDGTSSTSMSPSKTYSDAGTYTASLTVSDEEGLSDKAQVNIKVNQPPDLFPITTNAQWVYFVEATDLENGSVSDYTEGYTYITVKELNLEYTYNDFLTLRVSGRRNYNGQFFPNYIYLAHNAGKTLSVKHDVGESYNDMINLGQSSWNDYAMFFSRISSQSVSMSSMNLSVDMGTFHGYLVKYQKDNWGEQYVTERYDVTEEEFLDPDIGLIYRHTSRYVNFLDCFTCPVYGGGIEMQLVGYYIALPDGTILEDGYGYNPSNPYGGNQGLKTIWASQDIGYTEVYLNNEYVGMITNYWPDGLDCDQPRALNVSRAAGTYTLTAESNQGYYWEGTVTFAEGACETLELTLSKGGLSSRQLHLSGGPD